MTATTIDRPVVQRAVQRVDRPVARPVQARTAGRGSRVTIAVASPVTAPLTASRAPRPVDPAALAPELVGERAGVRLTRRGRLVVVLGLAVLLFAAFSLGRVGAEGSTSDAPQLRTVVVAPGDTLWGVASELAEGEDPRPVVEQIRRLNDLASGELRAGQQLVLPAAG